MTYNDINEMLQSCIKSDCKNCPIKNKFCDKIFAMQFALTFIDRQKMEIDRLQQLVLKQEDTMQLIAAEKQEYFDELQKKQREIDKLKNK